MEYQDFNKLRSAITYGERLSDGRVIDLLAPGPNGDLEIVVQDGEQSVVVPQVEHEGVIYSPPKLHPSLRRAMRIPTEVNEYEDTKNLFQKVMQLFCRFMAFSEESASVATAWVFSGWAPEYFAAPPVLSVTGARMGQAITFFRLLSTVTRRAITVADLSLRLPTELHPTLLIVESGLSKKVLASWRACNYYGVYLPAKGGALQELVCSKAIYSEIDNAIGSWGEEALRIVLLPANHLPAVTEDDLNSIAAEFQPQLQLYRLRRLQSRLQPIHDGCAAEVAGSALCQDLFALLADEVGVRKLLLPVVEQQRQATTARLSVDPLAVIIEVIWMPAHQETVISTSEVTKRVNALLRARGKKLEYTVREIGWKLSQLRLPRHRAAKGNDFEVFVRAPPPDPPVIRAVRFNAAKGEWLRGLRSVASG